MAFLSSPSRRGPRSGHDRGDGSFRSRPHGWSLCCCYLLDGDLGPLGVSGVGRRRVVDVRLEGVRLAGLLAGLDEVRLASLVGDVRGDLVALLVEELHGRALDGRAGLGDTLDLALVAREAG